MFRQAESARKRLNLHSVARIRSLEVARGRSGYGFTLCGQAPCLLGSILKGSPADYVGLKSGDQILSVNDVNVSKASHEDVVKLIGRCSGVLHLVIAEGSPHRDSCSSDEEFGFHETKSYWLKPKMDSKTLGINRAERVVAEMQSGGIFNMIFDNSSHSSGSLERAAPAKPRPLSEPDFPCRARSCSAKSHPDLLSEEEMAKVLNDDSAFAGAFEGAFENQEDFALDASVLNVGMIVGYLGSIELASAGANLESDSLQAIRGCMRRLRAEQRVHSLVMMKVMHDCVQLWSDRGAVLATYPAEKLAFSAMCPDDRRFFGLVTMQVPDDGGLARAAGEEEEEDEEGGGLRTSCHVFIVDPDLCPHAVHQGVARRFGFDCTPDPDTDGCLEFPPMSQPLLQFVSVLYRDMGESIEGVRARAFADGDLDAQQNHSTSSNSDSGIGNFLPEEKSSRVLLVDLGGGSGRHVPGGPWEGTQARSAGQAAALRNGYRYEQEGKFHLPELSHPDPPPVLSGRPLGPCARMEVPVPPRHPHYPNGKAAGVSGAAHGGGGQRWLPVHVLQDWRHGNASDQESYAESTDGWSSANCSTLPPPMSKIPADRYRAAGEIARPSRLGSHKDEWAKKLLSAEEAFADQKSGKRGKDREKKGSRFGGLALGFPHLTQRSSGRRSFGRSKRLSLARSLDDLESAAVSDGELNSADLKGCGSENSLSSNASLPSVQSHRRHGERRVASWAVCFERLLQDPVGVRYFSEFLKKEFSEENILFWQACEYFSHVPENDKKQLSQRAREIYNSFLSSKATTPVNIDSQAQLADDILNAPRPDMFKEQQLQIFNLMKFDSYSRFLKSPLYQECMVAEVEGRALPDPYHIPSSPASSKHSVNSDRSAISTPKKDGKKAKPGRSLNEDYRDEHVDKKKGIFFSWSRNRSFGKGPKKRDFGDFNYDFSDRNGRRESQGSLSSGASVELGVSGSGGKNEGDPRNAPSERDKAQRHCNINLPDGSCCPVPIRPGVSIREVLLGLCQKLCINLAAVDLFLVGGEKPLVLDQDCITLSSRDLRLEKRTLFRLDLVPINRSVGLKAKPTKPVTEVLRPVVAKYGLQLSHLVAKISGETEPLDLGLPISSLDGLRVILDVADHTSGKEKQKLVSSKSHAPPLNSRSYSTTGEEKPCSAKSRGEHGRPPRETRLLRKEESVDKVEKRKQKKINIDEAEEFFDLISKAQSNRANDQRGLLNKKDLVLPDFLRVGPDPACSTPNSRQPGPGRRRGGRENGEAQRSALKASHHSQSLDSSLDCGGPPGGQPTGRRRQALMPPGGGGGGRRPHPLDHAPFSTTLSPIPHAPPEKTRPDGKGVAAPTVEDDNAADLTLVGEGDISSPNSTLLPPTPIAPSLQGSLPEADFTPPPPCRDADQSSPDPRSRSDAAEGSSGGRGRGPVSPQGVQGGASPLPANRIIDVDGVRLEDAPRGDPDLSLSFEGYASELRECQGRMRRGVYNTSELPSLLNAPRPDSGQAREGACKATFV
ncbi:regulator of G-protein signaling 12-like isoform X1 [Anguilla rostrata]|uniref:regulator of G-protein signaling 12-like isoform X1 n=1 Tax=Anguilla rostrata TaxID=7938 RepID=UPI0030D5208D